MCDSFRPPIGATDHATAKNIALYGMPQGARRVRLVEVRAIKMVAATAAEQFAALLLRLGGRLGKVRMAAEAFPMAQTRSSATGIAPGGPTGSLMWAAWHEAR